MEKIDQALEYLLDLLEYGNEFEDSLNNACNRFNVDYNDLLEEYSKTGE